MNLSRSRYCNSLARAWHANLFDSFAVRHEWLNTHQLCWFQALKKYFFESDPQFILNDSPAFPVNRGLGGFQFGFRLTS